MKKFFIAVVTVVCLLSLTPKAKVKAYDNSEFKSQTIIKELHADLTGDHIEEYVVLTGLKNQDSPFYESVKITVSSEKQGSTLFSIIPRVNFGFNPDIFVGNFNNNGLQLLYSADSGTADKTGCFFLYDCKDENVKTLFDSESHINTFSCNYKNYYKIEVFSKEKKFLIDISNENKQVLKKLYKDAIVNTNYSPNISGVVNAVPCYSNENEAFYLTAVRKITILNGEVTVGYLIEKVGFLDENCNFKYGVVTV